MQINWYVGKDNYVFIGGASDHEVHAVPPHYEHWNVEVLQQISAAIFRGKTPSDPLPEGTRQIQTYVKHHFQSEFLMHDVFAIEGLTSDDIMARLVAFYATKK